MNATILILLKPNINYQSEIIACIIYIHTHSVRYTGGDKDRQCTHSLVLVKFGFLSDNLTNSHVSFNPANITWKQIHLLQNYFLPLALTHHHKHHLGFFFRVLNQQLDARAEEHLETQPYCITQNIAWKNMTFHKQKTWLEKRGRED